MKDSKQMVLFRQLSQQDSPARTCLSMVKQKDSVDQNHLYSSRLFGSFAWFDQDSASWRTYQRCLQGGWEMYSESYPRSGMTVSGIVYRLPVLVRLMRGTESGLWATPTAHNAQEGGHPSEYNRDSPNLTCEAIVGKPARSWTPKDSQKKKRGMLNPRWIESLMAFPDNWTDIDCDN